MKLYAFFHPPHYIMGAISLASWVNFPTVVVPHKDRAPGWGVACTNFAGWCPVSSMHTNARGEFQSHGGRSTRNRLRQEKFAPLDFLWIYGPLTDLRRPGLSEERCPPACSPLTVLYRCALLVGNTIHNPLYDYDGLRQRDSGYVPELPYQRTSSCKILSRIIYQPCVM